MTDQPKKSEEDRKPNLQFHVSPDLEYVYRDVFNVYVGTGDVVIEFGNLHRAMPGRAAVKNRITANMDEGDLPISRLFSQARRHRHIQNLRDVRCLLRGIYIGNSGTMDNCIRTGIAHQA